MRRSAYSIVQSNLIRQLCSPYGMLARLPSQIAQVIGLVSKTAASDRAEVHSSCSARLGSARMMQLP